MIIQLICQAGDLESDARIPKPMKADAVCPLGNDCQESNGMFSNCLNPASVNSTNGLGALKKDFNKLMVKP